jgi:hypothetical protein
MNLKKMADTMNVSLIKEPAFFLPPEETVWISWRSDVQKRLLKIEEADETETLKLNFSIDFFEPHIRYDDITVKFIKPDEYDELIFEIYLKCFVEYEPIDVIDEFLDQKFDEINCSV